MGGVGLTGATVVTRLDPVEVVTGDVRIQDGRIAGVGGAAAGASERRDCSGCVILPGNVCGHTHRPTRC